MAGYKVGRNSEDIRRELADIMRLLKDPRITGLLSIVRVELSGDMSHAKVYVSSMGGIAAAREAVQGLQHAAGFIRREINNRLSLRTSPELKFIADDSIEHGAEISRMLKDLIPAQDEQQADETQNTHE
ncbi:MAG: 30S ribosome-binding factor RbfA [Acetanaerobacterium sp.]